MGERDEYRRIWGSHLPQIVMQPRTPEIGELVRQCAAGALPFTGPDSLHAKARALGFSTNGLYEAVISAKKAPSDG